MNIRFKKNNEVLIVENALLSTGKYDKNGIEIFEGDCVKFVKIKQFIDLTFCDGLCLSCDKSEKTTMYGTVKYFCTGFVIETNDDFYDGVDAEFSFEELEVITKKEIE